MATKPFDLSNPDSIHPPVASVATRMVASAVNKYVDYLVKQADKDINLLIHDMKHTANNQLIEVADEFYERIPPEYR
jgi:hypothetical protein